MPNVESARLTHGSQEYGKDIIFYSPGGFGEKKLFACVIKNERISGASDSSSGARTVLIQAQTALDTPLVNEKGADEFVEHVYIITPNDCSPIAMHSIKGQMHQRSGQITFFCGNNLFELFQKYWPDYLLFESNYLEEYLASLRGELHDDSALTNILFKHSVLSEQQKSFFAVYVEQTFKIVLRQYILTAPAWPDTSVLDKGCTLSQIKELLTSLFEIGDLLPHLQTWAPDGIFGSSTVVVSNMVLTIANCISDSWAAAYSQLGKIRRHQKKNDRTAEINPVSFSEVQSSIPDTTALKVLLSLEHKQAGSQCHKSLQEYLNNLDPLVNKANEFICTKVKGAFHLSDSSYMSWRGLQELSRLSPSILRPFGKSVDLSFGEDLIQKCPIPLLVVGPAGYGKSSFCRWNVYKDIERLIGKRSQVIPIYVPMHRFSQGPLGTFEQTLFNIPELHKFTTASTNTGWQFRLYLDGLDEVPSAERQSNLLRLAVDGARQAKNLQLVITARDYVAGSWLSSCARVELAGLGKDQIRELITKWLDGDDSRIRVFFSDLAAVPSLGPLMKVPLLATLIIAVFRNPRLKRLPENKNRLYEMFVDLLYGGWDVAKNIARRSRYGLGVKLKILTRLASGAHWSRRRDFTEAGLKEALDETFKGLARDRKEILEDILQDGLIIKMADRYTFAHLSFQEYLAAKDLFDPYGERAAQALLYFLKGDDWWREVMSFYIGFSTAPKVIEKWIKQTAPKSWNKRATLDSRIAILQQAVAEQFPGYEFST